MEVAFLEWEKTQTFNFFQVKKVDGKNLRRDLGKTKLISRGFSFEVTNVLGKHRYAVVDLSIYKLLHSFWTNVCNTTVIMPI